jgi:hypothetical protein
MQHQNGLREFCFVLLQTGIVVFAASVALAHGSQPIDDHAVNAQATAKTVELLGDPSQLKKAAAANPAAQQNVANLEAVLGNNPAEVQEAQRIMQSVFPKLVEKAHGDSTAIMALLADLSAHPDKLKEYLSADDAARLAALAKRAEARGSAPTVAPRSPSAASTSTETHQQTASQSQPEILRNTGAPMGSAP